MAKKKKSTATRKKKIGRPRKSARDDFTEQYVENCKRFKVNPIAVLFKAMASPDKVHVNSITAAKELLSYMHPKKKAIEVQASGDIAHSFRWQS